MKKSSTVATDKQNLRFQGCVHFLSHLVMCRVWALQCIYV